MPHVLYGVCGEGRGHAARVRAIIEMCRGRAVFTVLASGRAYEMLAPRYRSAPDVTVREVSGLHFRYRGQRVCYWRSLWANLPWLGRLRRLVDQAVRLVADRPPDLAITDFEPLTARIARRFQIPLLSIDHQHYLSHANLSFLPRRLQRRARWLARFIPMYYSWQQETIVSSFHRFEPHPANAAARHVGVLLREEVARLPSTVGEHVLVYQRRHLPTELRQYLVGCRRPVRVYGVGRLPREGGVEYLDVCEAGFARDLASCQALICNAGNQLVGEALYHQKPVLAIPEAGNFEQELNGYCLQHCGGGMNLPAAEISAARIEEFLRCREQWLHHGRDCQQPGNPEVWKILNNRLPLLNAEPRQLQPIGDAA